MVQFNELRITPDGKKLIAEISVISGALYSNIYIQYVSTDSLNTFISTGPSALALAHEVSDLNNFTMPAGIYYTNNTTTKSIRLVADVDSINTNMFFLHVQVGGTPGSGAPCGTLNHIIGVVYYNKHIYNKGISLLKTINGCAPSLDFIDFILQDSALQLAIKSGDYSLAITYWNKFFKNELTITTRSCNCHGVS